MSSHLTGAHRRSADNNSRERHARTKDSSGGGNGTTDYTTSAGGHSRSRGQHSNENQVKEAIIDLYLKVKIRSKDEVSPIFIYSNGCEISLLSLALLLYPFIFGFSAFDAA